MVIRLYYHKCVRCGSKEYSHEEEYDKQGEMIVSSKSIEVCNLKKEKPTSKYDIRVDRASVLGNPFLLKSEDQRDSVCNLYVEWLTDHLRAETPTILEELDRIGNLVESGTVRLFCWCAPKRCHAETIRAVILHRVQHITYLDLQKSREAQMAYIYYSSKGIGDIYG